MKKIKFTDNLTNLIVQGKKISTWRLFDDKDLSEGDEVVLANKQSGEEFASAVIEKVIEKKLGEMDDVDWEGHERYESEEKMLADFKTFYPDKDVNLETMVKIINFRIVKFLV